MAGPPLSGPEQWVAPVVPLSHPHHCTAHSCRCLCLGGQPSCAILDAPNILPHLSSASLLLPLLHQLRCPVALFLLQRLRWQSLAPVILTSRRINGRSDTLYPFHSFQNNITATLTTFVAHALQRHSTPTDRDSPYVSNNPKCVCPASSSPLCRPSPPLKTPLLRPPLPTLRSPPPLAPTRPSSPRP